MIFTYKDFKQFNAPPETLARYCNLLIEQRTISVSLDKYGHDIIRNDAGFLSEVLDSYPMEARMTYPQPKSGGANG